MGIFVGRDLDFLSFVSLKIFILVIERVSERVKSFLMDL